MAPKNPGAGDRAIYRGKYREIVGFKSSPDDEPSKSSGPVCVLVNPETERFTYVRTQDLRWSDYVSAWFPFGLLLSREECALYSALMGLGQIVPADAHERALRVLDAEDLEGSLEDQTSERLARFAKGYDLDPGTVLETARELRAHRQGA